MDGILVTPCIVANGSACKSMHEIVDLKQGVKDIMMEFGCIQEVFRGLGHAYPEILLISHSYIAS